MKKIILTVAVAAAALSANAQAYIGGELGVWHDPDADKTTFSIHPEVGYDLSEKWALGIDLGYNFGNTKKTAEVLGHEVASVTTKTHDFTINPYARWSFVKFGPAKLFLDMGFGIDVQKEKVGDTSSDANTAWRVGVQPGIAVNLSKHVDFVAHLGFLGYCDSNDGKNSAYGNGFGFKVSGNDLTFGIEYHF